MDVAEFVGLLQNENFFSPDILLREVDHRVFDNIPAADIAAVEGKFDSRFVEDLLQSSLARVTNCLVLREKAHDLQLRALAEALDFIFQKRLARARADLEALHTPGGNAAADGLYAAIADPLDVKRDLSTQDGHALDFASRFAFLKELFEKGLKEAVARARKASEGLRDVYGIDLPLPAARDVGYLNLLSKWVQEANDAIDLENESRRWRKVIVSLASFDNASKTDQQLFTTTDFGTAFATGTLAFNITDAVLSPYDFDRPLLRDLKIIVDSTEPTTPRRWPCKVQLPNQAAHFSILAQVGDASLTEMEGARSDVYNLSPVGNWELNFSTRTSAGEQAAATVKNVHLLMTVSTRL